VPAEPDWSPVAQCTLYYDTKFILDIVERFEKAFVNKYIGFHHGRQEPRIRNDVPWEQSSSRPHSLSA
jgi:hypothetical protein